MNKINYDKVMEKIIDENKKEGKKPSLLLQVCCGPCSTSVLDRLKEDFAIDIFFYNPMIYPRSEFEKRAANVIKLRDGMDIASKVLIPENNISDFNPVALKRKEDKEFGRACFDCYELRLRETAKYAKENSYDFFSTTLSVSPYKNSQWLNEIGAELEEEFGVRYLFSDFKKKDGYKKSIDFSKQYDLYRQDYCGCVFSYKEMLDRNKC